MSQPSHEVAFYRPGAWNRLVEGLRYRGGIGQWSWLVHRATGLGILFFLIIHIIDTFLVVAYPSVYDHTVAIYGGMVTGLHPSVNGYYWSLRWLFRVGELGLIASVLFHSVNGVRIVLFDFWPTAALYQRRIFIVAMVVFWVIMLPVSVWVILPLLGPPESQRPRPAQAADAGRDGSIPVPATTMLGD